MSFFHYLFLSFALLSCITCAVPNSQPDKALGDASTVDAHNCVAEQEESGQKMVLCTCPNYDGSDCAVLLDSYEWHSMCEGFSRCLLRSNDECIFIRFMYSSEGLDSGINENSSDIYDAADENSDPCRGPDLGSSGFAGYGRAACLQELQRLGLCLDGAENCDPCDLSVLQSN